LKSDGIEHRASGNKKQQVKNIIIQKINPLKRLSIKLIGYCYIVVIKKVGTWGCWGGDNLPLSEI